MNRHTEKLELININKLIPHANNARTHSSDQIKKIQSSLREFGFINPVLIDKNCSIIAGHGRVEVARREGMTEIPCVLVEHLTEAQKRAYIIADNRLALDAEWDMEILKIELEELKEADFDILMTGFNGDEIDDIFVAELPGAVEDDYEIELPEEPKTHLGDTYALGRHRITCGDSTDPTVIERLMDGVRADLFLTDPPYNVDYEGGTGLKIKNDKMEDDAFRQFLREAFTAADNVMKPGAVFYIWHADSEGYNFRGACHDIGWLVRQCLIWNKNSLVMGRQDYHWKHEPCLYGWKDGAGHLWASDRKQTTILNFDRPSKSSEHPTMKPIKLFDYQIQNNTKGKDVVLDTFAGSGTTIIACEQNGRSARCCELDPKYCDVIVDRWEKLTGEKAVKL